MLTFIGILLLLGCSSVTRQRLYLSNEPDTLNGLVAQTMQRNHFDKIMKYFHSAYNHQFLAEDNFAKVSSFLEIFNKYFMKYSAGFGPENISIDESMIP